MKLNKWEIVCWLPLVTLLWNWGYYPNEREPEFRFWNFGFIEIRHFGAYNEKKVCKKCGKEV